MILKEPAAAMIFVFLQQVGFYPAPPKMLWGLWEMFYFLKHQIQASFRTDLTARALHGTVLIRCFCEITAQHLITLQMMLSNDQTTTCVKWMSRKFSQTGRS